MKKIAVLLVAVFIAISIATAVGAEDKKKTGTEKRRVVPLQSFVNSVAGKTDMEIKAIFGEPSCQGHYIFLGMLYENVVKDERSGEVFTAQILFKIGLPVGTVKMRDGRRVIGQSDFKFVASTIRCPYYTFEIDDAGDTVTTNYNIYVRPWRATSLFPMNTQPIPSCEELNRENDRINQEINKKEDRKKEEPDWQKIRKETEEQDRVHLEKLIGKQVNLDNFRGYGWSVPHKLRIQDTKYGKMVWIHDPRSVEGEGLRGEEFVTNEGEKYILVLISKTNDAWTGTFPWIEPWKPCPNCNAFKFYLIEDRNKDGTDYVILECSINCRKREVSIQGPRVSIFHEDYADNSPIELISSKLKEWKK